MPMRWIDVVAAYPNQWLVIEALEAHVEVVDVPPAVTSHAPTPEAVPCSIDGGEDEPASDGVIAAAIAADATIVADTRRPSQGWTFRRVLDRVRVLELCADGRAALHASREHRRTCASRDVVCVHTSYPSLQFEERVVPRRRRAPSERQRALR